MNLVLFSFFLVRHLGQKGQNFGGITKLYYLHLMLYVDCIPSLQRITIEIFKKYRLRIKKVLLLKMSWFWHFVTKLYRSLGKVAKNLRLRDRTITFLYNLKLTFQRTLRHSRLSKKKILCDISTQEFQRLIQTLL